MHGIRRANGETTIVTGKSSAFERLPAITRLATEAQQRASDSSVIRALAAYCAQRGKAHASQFRPEIQGTNRLILSAAASRSRVRAPEHHGADNSGPPRKHFGAAPEINGGGLTPVPRNTREPDGIARQQIHMVPIPGSCSTSTPHSRNLSTHGAIENGDDLPISSISPPPPFSRAALSSFTHPSTQHVPSSSTPSTRTTFDCPQPESFAPPSLVLSNSVQSAAVHVEEPASQQILLQSRSRPSQPLAV